MDCGKNLRQNLILEIHCVINCTIQCQERRSYNHPHRILEPCQALLGRGCAGIQVRMIFSSCSYPGSHFMKGPNDGILSPRRLTTSPESGEICWHFWAGPVHVLDFGFRLSSMFPNSSQSRRNYLTNLNYLDHVLAGWRLYCLRLSALSSLSLPFRVRASTHWSPWLSSTLYDIQLLRSWRERLSLHGLFLQLTPTEEINYRYCLYLTDVPEGFQTHSAKFLCNSYIYIVSRYK